MASYDETLVNITLTADASIAVDTSPPYTGTGAGFQYRFVRLTDDHTVGLYTNADDEAQIPVGVLQNKPQIVDMAATVAIAGISLVEAGGTVEAGDVVGPDTTGRAVASGTGSDCGVAIYGGAEGELVPVLIRPTTVGSTATA